MAIISFSKDTLIEYIPFFGGNRESKDPCVVRLRHIPHSRVAQFKKIVAERTSKVLDPAKAVEVTEGIQKDQFIASVESVSDYFVDGREVTDPGEFFETASAALIRELIIAMENSQVLNEGQRKN